LHTGTIAGNVSRVNPSAPPPPAVPPRFNVLGAGVSALSLEQARDLVLGARGKKQLGYVCQATAYGVSMAVDDAEFRTALNGSWLTNPDGMPLVWLGRWHGHAGITRVYGPDLMEAVCDSGRTVGLRHFFYGGAPGVAEALCARLSTRFPGLEVAGTFTPPFRDLSPDEFTALRNVIADARPDIVWVGLSSPKQEKFMAAYWRELNAGVLVGVGAAFDFLSGRVPQAPRGMQRSGLEWLFRLGTEPRRLWKRYLIHNPLFVLRTAAQFSGLRKYSSETTDEH
jgi:N-acetylglucosaminyldiphosphoundecaprenol N-acetyl-beta-D-mannosaminyltransferase